MILDSEDAAAELCHRGPPKLRHRSCLTERIAQRIIRGNGDCTELERAMAERIAQYMIALAEAQEELSAERMRANLAEQACWQQYSRHDVYEQAAANDPRAE